MHSPQSLYNATLHLVCYLRGGKEHCNLQISSFGYVYTENESFTWVGPDTSL